MNTYRNLRDLPGAPKGTVFREQGDLYYPKRYFAQIDAPYHLRFSIQEIESLPEWFTLIKEETLKEETLIDAVRNVVTHRCDTGCLGAECECLSNLRTVYERIKQEGK